MYRNAFGVVLTSDAPANPYLNRGCNAGDPPADEKAQIDRVLAIEYKRALDQMQCERVVGPGRSACLSSVAQGYAAEIDAYRRNFAGFCDTKYGQPSAPPLPPPVPCAPLPPPSPLPALPGSPILLRGYACFPGVTVGVNQNYFAQRLTTLQNAMQNAVSQVQAQYQPQLDALRANCGSPQALHDAETAMLAHVNDTVGYYQQQINKALSDLDGSCAEAALPPPPEVPVVTTTPETTPVDVFPGEPPVTTAPPAAPKQASMMVGGIVLLVVLGVGYGVYRATKKEKRS